VGREAFLTLPGIRVCLIDDLRNGGDENRDENKAHGVNEVRLRQGRIVREGLHITLGELRLRGNSPNSRKRWLSLCGRPSLICCLRRTPALRGNLSERADGGTHAGSLPRTRRGHSAGSEGSPRQPIGSEYDAQHSVAVSRSPVTGLGRFTELSSILNSNAG